jgi:hypothetical protein
VLVEVAVTYISSIPSYASLDHVLVVILSLDHWCVVDLTGLSYSVVAAP